MRRLWNAFFYSMAGLRAAWHEPAARLEISCCSSQSRWHAGCPWGWLKSPACRCPVALFVVEILNTSVEAAIDRISEVRHPLSKLASGPGQCRGLRRRLLCADRMARARRAGGAEDARVALMATGPAGHFVQHIEQHGI